MYLLNSGDSGLSWAYSLPLPEMDINSCRFGNFEFEGGGIDGKRGIGLGGAEKGGAEKGGAEKGGGEQGGGEKG